jgi:TPR repeat protein
MGVPKDEAVAAKWWTMSAERGYVPAQFSLGVAYSKGAGVAWDETEAVRWYKKAAEQGFADAQFNLAVAYRFGQGVLSSNSAAVEWYSKAGESYLKEGRREDALTCYDRMKALDPAHPLTKALFAKLYPE